MGVPLGTGAALWGLSPTPHPQGQGKEGAVRGHPPRGSGTPRAGESPPERGRAGEASGALGFSLCHPQNVSSKPIPPWPEPGPGSGLPGRSGGIPRPKEPQNREGERAPAPPAAASPCQLRIGGSSVRSEGKRRHGSLRCLQNWAFRLKNGGSKIASPIPVHQGRFPQERTSPKTPGEGERNHSPEGPVAWALSMTKLR